MSKKVLLVYPGKYGQVFPELPLPLLYLSSALLAKGFEPVILDTRIENYKDKQLNYDEFLFIGITCMTGDMIKYALEFAKFSRNHTKIPLVWGGIHPSLLTEETLENEYVDVVVKGEGDVTVTELAKAYYNEDSLENIKGIAYKKDSNILYNDDREFMDMDDIDTIIPYHLIEMDKYYTDIFPIHTSRGCPYKCAFCYNTIFNKKKYRTKSAEKVIEEIQYVVKEYNVKKISLTWEDEFFIDLKRVKKICELLIEKQIDIEWEAFCTINMFCKVDDELLELVQKSGCKSLSFGIESGSPRVLKEIIKKGTKIEKVLHATEKISKTNLKQIVSFIVGSPTETDEERQMSFDLLDQMVKLNPKILPNGFFLYTPYPGTEMFNMVVNDYGYKPPRSLEEWSEFGIYRNIEATWYTKEESKQFKILSLMTRFPFYRSRFTMKDVKNMIAADGRWSKFPYNYAYWFFTNIAILRWKKRFFHFGYEFLLLEKILVKMRGFY